MASGDIRLGEETRLADLLEGAELADRGDEIFACFADYSGIYMELGVRTGATLATRLL